MKKLKVKRFKQEPAHCAVASCAVYTNYFNEEVDYEFTKQVAYKVSKSIPDDGMDDPEMGILLNLLGFRQVDIICSDLRYLDYSWASLSKAALIELFEKEKRRKVWQYEGFSSKFKLLHKFLSMEGYSNSLVIDYNFGERIRAAIDQGIPPIVTFNWSLFFKFPKCNEYGETDAVHGSAEEHAVVVNGYSDKGVYIIDSHQESYKYSLKEYRSGRYFVPWEILMTIMGSTGTVIIGYDYRENLNQYELV